MVDDDGIPPGFAKLPIRRVGLDQLRPAPARSPRDDYEDFVKRHGYPHCARCGRPVDRVTICEEPRRLGPRLEIRVECHGEREIVLLGAEDLERMRDGSLRFGEAFLPVPKLP